jgi:hypothetical protein
MYAVQPAEPISQTLARAYAKGGGAWRLVLIGPLAVASLAHDPHAQRLVLVLNVLRRRLDAHTEPDPVAPACLLCPQPFWRECHPAVIGVLHADVAEPDATCVCAVCHDCWAAREDDQALRTTMLGALRTRYGLELRVLPPMLHAPGHA